MTAYNLFSINDGSDNHLFAPSELLGRRLSDSIICGTQEKQQLAKQSESDLLQLRKWASEVIKVRSGYPFEVPMDRFDSARCHSSQTADFSESTLPDLQVHNAGSRRDGSRFKALPSTFNRSDEQVSSLATTSPSHLTRSVPVRRKPRRRATSVQEESVRLHDERLDFHAHAHTSSNLLETPKMDSQKTLLPALFPSNEGAASSSTSSLSPLSGKSSVKSQHLKLSFSPSHSLLLSPDQNTPRAKSILDLSSPTWTTSTCESDNDKFNLMTPSDELGPRQSKIVTIPLSQPYSEDTITPMEDSAAELDRGLSMLGLSSSEESASTIAVRRGSLPPITTRSRVSFASAPMTSQLECRKASNSSPNSAPVMNRSTLYDLGCINGITPPALREQGAYSSGSHSGNVVNAGLEMGLGAATTTSAFSSAATSSSSSSIKSSIVSEPRFARNTVPLSTDFETYASNRLFESQLQMPSTPAPARYTSDVASDQAAEEMSFTDLDREEAELARRRTTGNLAGNKRESGMVGTRRHIRAGTHEPRNANLNGINKGAHRLTSSVSTFPSLVEEYTRPAYVEEPSLRLDIGDNHGRGLNTSVSNSSISEAIASGGLGSTPWGTPAGSYKAMLSPDLGSNIERRSYISCEGEGSKNALGMFVKSEARDKVDKANEVANPPSKVMMGLGGGGHFGPGVRAKIAEILTDLIEKVPVGVSSLDSETIQLVEYGCLNSRSVQLMQLLISSFADKRNKQCHHLSTSHDTVVEEGRGILDPVHYSSNALSFQVTHEDNSAADFRPVTQILDHYPESYLDSQWQDSHSPSLANSIFTSFAARPFASRIAPPKTFHAGISLMDLHWIHTPITSTISPAIQAQAELTAFLSARANEFQRGGLLVMAYIARSEELNQQKDIWTTLSNTLAPCIQRLVSCSMVKSDVARHLLNLPMHPRSAQQTKSVLEGVDSFWKLEWSCGLGYEDVGSSGLTSEPQTLRLPHPAWKAYNSGTLSRVPFTEHMIQLFKNLYESHFRNILREKGKLSKGAVEFVLDSLWDVLFSRIVDQNPSPMKDVEVEVSIVALRRN